jgi:hypothetical protein
VRDAGQELALILELALDALGHLVDRLCQQAHLALVVVAEPHAALELAFTDFAGHSREILKRSGQAPRQLGSRGPDRQKRSKQRGRHAPPRKARVVHAAAHRSEHGAGATHLDRDATRAALGARRLERATLRVLHHDAGVECGRGRLYQVAARSRIVPHAREAPGRESFHALHVAAPGMKLR